MSQLNSELDFDFKKITQTSLKSIEKQSYKKLLFLTIGLSIFTSMGIWTTNSIHNHFVKSNAMELKQNEILLQEIKNLNDNEFNSMIQFINQNSNIFDEKVGFVQSIIAKSEIEDFGESMGTSHASKLGQYLTEYKIKLVDDSTKLQLIRKEVLSGGQVDRSDYSFFNKYLIAYKTHSIIHDTQLEDSMNELLFSSNTGNNKYNNKYKIYESIKIYDQKINNTFNTFNVINVDSSSQTTNKPKI